MKNSNRWSHYASTVSGLALLLATAGTAQGVADGGVAASPELSDAAAIQAYWTPERMASAEPMPVPAAPVDVNATPAPPPPTDAVPGWSPGWAPGSGAQPDPSMSFFQNEDEFLDGAVAAAGVEPLHGPKPTNPKNGPYPPFQRWTWFGNYLSYPTSTVGKLFFTLPGQGNFVCSASVIGRSTVATAGHCVSSGDGTWATNMLFCPSYYKAGGSGGPHPDRGCWVGVTQVTSTGWHNNGDFDRDYGCIVTQTTGTSINDKIGNVTGWTGRAWNWYGVQEVAQGYPQAAPFPGYHIVTAVSTDWYTHDWGGDTNQYAKFIGNDSTGGSSGGPWWLAIRHRTAEYPDTDGNNGTDPGQPGGPYINGVNSHKRCAGSCFTPPTTTSGTFWQEMGSSAFRGTDADGGESEDVFAVCLANGNN